MDKLIDYAIALLLIVSWLGGTVLANGFVSTTVAIIFPPYSWYLVIEKLIIANGLM